MKTALKQLLKEHCGSEELILGEKQPDHRHKKGGISDPRNKALMKMFNMIGIGERAGSGVPDIFAVWESQGWKAPEVEEQYNPDRTILTLSFEKQAIKIMCSPCQGQMNLQHLSSRSNQNKL